MLLGAALLANAAMAQFDDVKAALIINKVADAKQKLEALMAKPKNQTKPEGYILKAALIDKLAKEPGNEGKVDEMRDSSIAAYRKYLEMDPAKSLVNDPTYQGVPISYYMDFFNTGYKAFQGKEWEKASNLFDKTVEWGSFLISNKMVKMEFDTNAHVLAGASYQNWKKEDEAAKYFTKVTDRKIGGEGNDFMYQFLMGYYFRANQIDKFEAIRAVGKELYPTNEYFLFTEADFITDMSDGPEKIGRIEARLQKDPSNPENIKLIADYGKSLHYKLNSVPDLIGKTKDEVIAMIGNPKNVTSTTTEAGKSEMMFYDGVSINLDAKGKVDWVRDEEGKLDKELPVAYGVSNYDEIEQKMIQMLSKAGDLLPEDGTSYFYIGDHFVRKAGRVDEEIRKVGEQIKKANANAKPDKTGKLPPPPKELTEKRESLKKAYDVEIEKGLPYLIKAAEAYAKMPGIKGMDLKNYKSVADLLIIIYGNKKNSAKQPADKAKWEAEEKKWNDIYSKISH